MSVGFAALSPTCGDSAATTAGHDPNVSANRPTATRNSTHLRWLVHARSLASLEMFTGVMYLALVVSRLIGLTLAPREK